MVAVKAEPRSPQGAVTGRSSWPVRSGTVPALADRLRGPARDGARPGGRAGGRSRGRVGPRPRGGPGPGGRLGPGEPGPRGGPGTAPDPAAQDWLRASGKTQLAAAFAESLWQSRKLDLLVWIQATSRASVLSGYAAATAAATGRDQATSCESVAAQFVGWLGETSRSWLVVLDDLADPADLDGLWPAGPAGRVLVTCADAAAIPRGMQVLPVGLFNSREALSYLMERLSANPGQRFGAIDLVSVMGFEPAALTQASAVIASSTMSCHDYREYFVRRRQQLTDSSGAPPPASAVTWTLSLERADQLAPGGSVQSLLALAALLDGHGIPATVLTAPAAAGYLTGGGEARAGSEAAARGAGGAGTRRPADRRTRYGTADGPDQPGAASGAARRDAGGHAGSGGPGGRGRAAPGLAGSRAARLARFRPALVHGGPAADHRKPAVGRRLPSGAAPGRGQPGPRPPDRSRGGPLARPGHDQRPAARRRASAHDTGRAAAGRGPPGSRPTGRRRHLVSTAGRHPGRESRAGSP